MKKLDLETNQTREGAETSRSTGWRANLNYKNQFGEHGIDATFAYQYSKYEVKGVSQDVKNANYTGRLTYNFDSRYIVELAGAFMGSNRFEPGKKYFFSPSAGLAWVISNEKFINNPNINFLKLKSSWGVLGYDRNTDYLQYLKSWSFPLSSSGTQVNFGEGNSCICVFLEKSIFYAYRSARRAFSLSVT